MGRPAREFPAHLNDLGLRLRDLASEVRGAVAEFTGDALGRAVRDALTRFWRRQPDSASRPRPQATEAAPYGWTDDPANDPWRAEEASWSEEYRSPMPAAPDRQNAEVVRTLLEAGKTVLLEKPVA